MTKEEVDTYAEESGVDLLLADGFEQAIIGVGSKFPDEESVVYDYDKCVSILMERDSMTQDDAVEYMEFNVVQAYVGKATPIFVRTQL